jgi:DNA-binding response OmpR family regulator
MSRILVVEDEQHLAEGLRFNLEAEGYQAEVVDGEFVPTLILTARGHSDDVLEGFAAGADDYLAKPFDLNILIARIQGLLRRREWLRRAHGEPPSVPTQSPSSERPDIFTFGDKSVYFDLLELRVRDQVFPLTLMEMNVLRYVIRHEGKPVSRKSMLEEVWGLHEDTDTRAIDNFIVRLRRYIEDDPTKPRHLLTVRGVGYRFIANPPSPS